jgi:sec-independent protein translocase protein TatB
MPGFEDSAFIVLLALLLFGPKKLPELARQLGKLMADFRRASNEFRVQMEDELRVAEQAERQKKLAASSSESPSAATPATVPALDPAQTQAVEAAYANQDLPLLDSPTEADPQTSLETAVASTPEAAHESTVEATPEVDFKAASESAPTPTALPIAISAEPMSLSESFAEAVAPPVHASEAEHVSEVLHG